MSAKKIAPEPPSAGKALITLPILVIAVIGYTLLSRLFGIIEDYAGIFFLLFWVLIEDTDPKEFAPTLLGSLGGLIPGYALHVMPEIFGTAGLVAVILVALGLIYVQMRDLLPILINIPFMLMFMLSSVPPVAEQANFVGLALSILLSGAYFGGLLFIVNRLSQPKGAAEPA